MLSSAAWSKRSLLSTATLLINLLKQMLSCTYEDEPSLRLIEFAIISSTLGHMVLIHAGPLQIIKNATDESMQCKSKWCKQVWQQRHTMTKIIQFELQLEDTKHPKIQHMSLFSTLSLAGEQKTTVFQASLNICQIRPVMNLTIKNWIKLFKMLMQLLK